MANKKISELQSRTPSLSDLLLVGDPSSGYSYKCTVTALATIIETDIADGYVTIGTTQTISGAKTFSNNLTLTSVSNANTDTDKFLVLNASNIVNFRTGAEVLSDIGGQGALTLTTTGSSGASTLVGNTLNIPTYTLSGLGGISGSGSTGYLPKFTGTTSIGNSIVQDNGSTLNIAGGIICNAISASSLTSDQYIAFQNINTSYSLSGYTMLYATLTNPGFIFNFGDGTRSAIFRYAAGSYTYTLPSATGTLALTSDITNSVSGTIGFIAKFTGTGSVGISQIYESGTSIGIGTTSPGTKLHVVGGNAWSSNFYEIGRFQKSSSTGVSLGYDNTAYVATIGAYSHDGTASNLAFWTYPGSGTALERMRLDASGNLGLGVTPSAVDNTLKYFEVGNAGNSFAAFNGGSAIYLLSGALYNAGWKYAVTGSGVNRYDIGNGVYTWYTAPSGTAGNAISFTQAMTLDASGRLGIGTTSPAVKLDVNGDVNLASGYTLSWGGAYGANIPSIAGVSGVGSNIRFYPSGSTTGETMRITSTGNVGIGTTSPATKLHVLASDGLNEGLAATIIRQGGSAGNNGLLVDVTNTVGQYVADFRIANSSVMRLDASGNLGIGTTSPSYKLQVQGPVPVNEAISDIIMITDNASNSGYLGIARSSSTQNGLALSSDGKLVFRVGSTTEAMTIRSTGNVGIGTTSPTAISNYIALTINGTSGSFTEYQENGGRAFRIGSDGATGGFISQTSADPIRIFTSSTERMRITSGGEVLIGTTSDAGDYKLQVNGNSYLNANNGTLSNNILVVKGGGATGAYGFRVEANNGDMIFQTNNYTYNSEFGGSIKTAAPSGGTAKPWKFGEAVSTAVTLSGYAVVEIDGVAYKLALVTAN